VNHQPVALSQAACQTQGPDPFRSPHPCQPVGTQPQ
jgi:hypothetical protein